MSVKRWIAGRWAANRARGIRRTHLDPVGSQEATLRALIAEARNTAFGRDHDFRSIRNAADFRERVPVRDYEQARVYFDRIRKGEANVSWKGKPLYLAKTSGTTSGAKYIPITRDSIRYQIKGARDALLLYMHNTGNTAFLDGKMMFLSGSPVLEQNEYGMQVGRLSGIVNHFVPSYLTKNRVPSYETNCIEVWEEKVEKILDEIIPQDLRLISGIPPWVQMLFERLEERTGRKPLEQWPNLSLFAQGGVDFSPYQPVFDQYLQGKVDMLELFPASEGFFALQDTMDQDGLLLNLDYGIYYEFIPLEDYHAEQPRRLSLSEVEVGQQYVLVVSTNAGLWAYDIGDTVKFVSTSPYRLKVSGRVKHFISAFGEHVISEEVNRAMVVACAQHGAEVNEFTVAPFLGQGEGSSYHEWWVEFGREPEDFEAFAATLDAEMRTQNSYYDDLRRGHMLRQLELRRLKTNACREYMRAIGKLGGQNKFPRLSNNRSIAEQLEPYILNSQIRP